MTLTSQTKRECVYTNIDFCNSGTEHKVRVVPLDDITANEIQMGDMVKKIPGYTRMFAPVESACPLDVAKVGAQELEKCMAYNDQRKYTAVYERRTEPLMEYLRRTPLASAHRMRGLLEIALGNLHAEGIIHGKITRDSLVVTEDTRMPLIRGFEYGRAADSDEAAMMEELARLRGVFESQD